MSKSSLDYWREREQEANKRAIKDEAAYNKRIEEIYSYTERNIQRTINDFYARYASKEGITMNEAKKRVREIDMRHYEQLARKYVQEHDFSEQANEEMALYNLTMKVNRLELLKAEINLELIDGYNDIEKEMRKDLLEQAMKVDARYAGILGKSAIGNQKYAHQLVNASFMGATFSERLWGVNMPDLRAHLEVELRNGLIRGIHPRKLAQRFRKHYGGSVQDTERLMITEMRRLQTAVQAESFERNGFKEYLFITAGDERVCPECAKLHGQHFKVSEMQVGENAPPMHPRCHCSTTAYMDSDKYKRWIEALANGEDVRWDEFESGEYEKRKAEEVKAEKVRFTPAKNIKEAAEYAKENFADDVSLGRLSLANANRINAELTRIFDMFKLNRLKTIQTKGGSSCMSANFNALNINPSKLGKVLENEYNEYLKNRKYYEDSIKLMEGRWEGKKMPHRIQSDIEKLRDKLKFSRWGVLDTHENKLEACVDHEFGHVLADQYFGQINGNRVSKAYDTNWSHRTLVDKIDAVFRKAKDTGDIYSISEYASKNSHEFFAECFSMHLNGEKLPGYISSAMNEVFEHGIMQ